MSNLIDIGWGSNVSIKLKMPDNSTRCGLCMRTRELQESHLIPAAIYRLLRDADPNHITITIPKSFTTSKQVSAPFLCYNCEQRFSRNGENYVLSECAQPDGSFPLREKIQTLSPLQEAPSFKIYDVKALLGSNVDQYLYFAASIFWRSSAHRWKMGIESVGHISLGKKYQEQFRLYLLGESSWPQNARIHVHVSSEEQPLMQIVFPCSSRIDGVHCHKFYIPGLLFVLLLGSDVPKRPDAGSLNGGPHQVMLLCPWENDSLFRGATNVMKTSRPAGKLRR